MVLKIANNALSTLAASINTSVTSLALASGDAGKFPTLGAGDWFPLTIVDPSGNMEIVKVTARSGATLTIVRAQEGTTAKAFAAGSKCDLRLTAAALAVLPIDASAVTGLAALIDTSVGAVVGEPPEELNTLEKLANAVGDNPTFAQTVTTQLGQKAASADVYTKAQVDAAIGAVQGVPSGMIVPGAMATAPTGWLKCNGAAISRSTYSALFAALVTNAGFTQQAFTVSIGSPGLFTKAAHGFLGGERLRLSTSGALPTGLNTTTDYFVIFVSVDTFYLSTSDTAPVPINTSGTQSGTHTYLPSWWGVGDGTTTFNVPDLRGAFVRGMEGFGRSLDGGRSVGSFQRDAMQPITGSAGGTMPGAATGAFFYFGAATDSWSRGGGSGTATSSRVDFDSSRQVRTAAETRPVNVAAHYFIKI
jgi:hypothetical protein